MELVDYAFSVPSVASLIAAGKHGAGRYIGPGSASKHLTAAERDRLFAAGLCIWLSVEGQPNDALQGTALGASHGAQAVQAARALGAPAGVALYGNVDFDVTATQWPACRNYLMAFAAVVRAAGFRAGLYGGLNAVEWGFRDHVADFYWQTYAWSHSVWSVHAVLQQYHNGVAWPGGGDVDLCRSLTADFGQWTKAGHPPTTEGETMYAFKEKSSPAVWMSNGLRRRSMDWAAFGQLVAAGYVQKPPAAMADGQNASAYVMVIPDGQADLYGGMLDTEGSGLGGLVPHTHDVAATGPAQPTL